MTPWEQWCSETKQIEDDKAKLVARQTVADQRLEEAQKVCKHEIVQGGFFYNECQICMANDL